MLIDEALKSIEVFQEVKEEYSIKDLSASIWAFEKLKELQDKKKEVEKIGESLITEKTERIKRWVDDELAPIENQMNYFKTKILEYYVVEKQNNPKFKLTTPYGKVDTRTAKKWYYQDAVLLEYLKENEPELVRVKEEVNKADLKKKYPAGINETTGEIIPGVDIQIETTSEVKVEV